jgi:hypothetical protein
MDAVCFPIGFDELRGEGTVRDLGRELHMIHAGIIESVSR